MSDWANSREMIRLRSAQTIRLRSAQVAPNKDALHPFDLVYGTDTGGYLSPREIVTGHAHDALGYGYSAIAPSVFREMMRRWLATLAERASGAKAPDRAGADVAAKAATHKAYASNAEFDVAADGSTPLTTRAATHKADAMSPAYAASAVERCAAYRFVDIGAGKGRALLLASELPFRKVIGVELSAELAAIAQANAERWSRAASANQNGGRSPIRVLRCDALQFRWPRPGRGRPRTRHGERASLLVFLYNPFACELVERLLERLENAALQSRRASKRRDRDARPSSAIDLLYANPTCADVVSKRGKWVLLWTDRIDMDEADQAADPYGTTFDRVSCYRLRPGD